MPFAFVDTLTDNFDEFVEGFFMTVQIVVVSFVGLMVFGGSGIFLYLAAWLLMPDETTERSIAQRMLDRIGLGGGFFASVLIVVGAIVLINVLGNVADRSGGLPAVVFALAVIAVAMITLAPEIGGR